MDPITMGKLGAERHESLVRDADSARLMGLSGKGRRKAGTAVTTKRLESDCSQAVEAALSAILRCRWLEARRAVTLLPDEGSGSAVRLAVTAILARLTGPHELADDLAASLPGARQTSSLGSHTWAATTVAMALEQWAGTAPALPKPDKPPGISPASTNLLHELCAHAQTVGSKARDLLCLALALEAGAGQDVVLGSFLLGHLAELFAGSPSGAGRPGSSQGSPAGYAAMGISLVTVGDIQTGRRFLLGVVDSTDTLRTPLVEGLVAAELGRIEHMGGGTVHSGRWVERTRQFADRYECSLPSEVVLRV